MVHLVYSVLVVYYTTVVEPRGIWSTADLDQGVQITVQYWYCAVHVYHDAYWSGSYGTVEAHL